jgi:hypothetical protein
MLDPEQQQRCKQVAAALQIDEARAWAIVIAETLRKKAPS